MVSRGSLLSGMAGGWAGWGKVAVDRAYLSDISGPALPLLQDER